MLRSTAPVPTTMDQVNLALDESSTETIKITNVSPVAGKSLGTKNLRGTTGARVAVRTAENRDHPEGYIVAGDTLFSSQQDQ